MLCFISPTMQTVGSHAPSGREGRQDDGDGVPKSGEQTVVRRVGVLIFIDDEGSVLAAKFTQYRKPAMKVFLQGWTIIEQREGP